MAPCPTAWGRQRCRRSAGDRQRAGHARPAPDAAADDRRARAGRRGRTRRGARGGGLVKVAMELNGSPVELECRGDEMLLDVLRREAGLSSVRETCRIGVCGACTVPLDDEPVSGCLLLAPQAAGRRVTTVEGLPEGDPTVRAFTDRHAFQCGYCTPGFVLTARALLEERRSPASTRSPRRSAATCAAAALPQDRRRGPAGRGRPSTDSRGVHDEAGARVHGPRADRRGVGDPARRGAHRAVPCRAPRWPAATATPSRADEASSWGRCSTRSRARWSARRPTSRRAAA